MLHPLTILISGPWTFFVAATKPDLGVLLFNATVSTIQGLAKGILSLTNLTVTATLNGIDGITKGLEKKN